MRYYTTYESPLGKIFISGDENAVQGLWFSEQKFFPSIEMLGEENNDLQIFNHVKSNITSYFYGEIKHINIPIKPAGTEFQCLIWQILQTIPYGQTMTYGEIAIIAAQRLGRKAMSAQAVGNAVGHNPISILIPCHRVIGTDGSLTGYAGGLWRKKALLELESANSRI